VDYASTPITATFPAGTTSVNINVPVMNDDIVEGTELFDIEITIDNSSRENAQLGNINIATVQITDSTG